MRVAFTSRMAEIAAKKKDVILITNDAPTPPFLEFRSKHPERFINAGLAEQNMTGMAAGLALSGKTVFTYSIIPFVMMRCYEQVRDDVCYQNANVKVIGIGGGICYASLGGTHTALEDVSLMRSIPNMTVISPADAIEAKAVCDAVASFKGPVYVRLGRAGEPILYNEKKFKFKIGEPRVMRTGKDVAIVGYGPILVNAIEAADNLKKEGLSVRVVNFPTLKPFNEKALLKIARETQAIVTLEEHSIVGGIASIVSEVLAKNQVAIPFVPIALKHEWLTIYGKQTDLWNVLGLSSKDIEKAVKKVIASKKK